MFNNKGTFHTKNKKEKDKMARTLNANTVTENLVIPTDFFIPEAFANIYNKVKTGGKKQPRKVTNPPSFNISDAFMKAYDYTE